MYIYWIGVAIIEYYSFKSSILRILDLVDFLFVELFNNLLKNKIHFRYSLLSSRSLLKHLPGEKPLWVDKKWSNFSSVDSLCSKGVFTFPITWMIPQFQSMQGKLLCPKCSAKIGSYDWVQGNVFSIVFFIFFVKDFFI